VRLHGLDVAAAVLTNLNKVSHPSKGGMPACRIFRASSMFSNSRNRQLITASATLAASAALLACVPVKKYRGFAKQPRELICLHPQSDVINRCV
jgi:hypothetical protein